MIGLLLLVAVLAAVLAVFLLRDAAQADARRRLHEALQGNPDFAAIRSAFVRVQIVVTDALTPALQEAARACAAFGEALAKAYNDPKGGPK